LRRGFQPAEGIEVIERTLALSEPRMLVSTLEFPQLIRKIVEGLVQASTSSAGHGQRRRSVDEEDPGRMPPETRAVIHIWEELLGAESIQPEDNFFELGGHSLLGTMVLARIRERFGIELSIRTIFEASTPEALGQRIRETIPVEVPAEAMAIPGEREECEC
jgi:phthiocerol/phenolphthiocerol synthesis type-I polyketide synthase E